MKGSAKQVFHKMRQPVVAAFAVWLSGLVCLFCCAVSCAEASDSCGPSETVAVAEESGEHACCAKQRRAEEQAKAEEIAEAGASTGLLTTETEMDRCCGMHARATVPAPLPGGVQLPAADLVQADLPVLLAETVPVAYPRKAIPPLNRGDTYVRCCVFLI